MKYDEIGYWSEIKLDVVKEYAAAYSTIMCAQKKPSLKHFYIDAFAGTGIHFSKTKEKLIPGSPLNALYLQPPFKEYHLIDMDRVKAQNLRDMCKDRPEVAIYEGDCNKILMEKVFPRVKWENYCRGLCLLDPYGLHLNWEIMHTAGQMKTIDLFINFPVMDINMNAAWRNPEKADAQQLDRMNAFWGDDSWRSVVYDRTSNLFGWEEKMYNGNTIISKAFQERLKKVAGFKHVPAPMPMRNTRKAVVYYLFFAAQKPAAENIVLDIFAKYGNRGANV